MIIQNYRKLAQSRTKKNVLKILESGLSVASPAVGLEKHLKNDKIVIGNKSIKLSDYSATYIVSFGKAADSMARVVNSILDFKIVFAALTLV